MDLAKRAAIFMLTTAQGRIKTTVSSGIWHGEQLISFTTQSLISFKLLDIRSLALIAPLELSRDHTKLHTFLLFTNLTRWLSRPALQE